MLNPYLPKSIRIKAAINETPEIKKFVLAGGNLSSFKLAQGLSFIPGQFILAGMWGIGEAPFGLSGDPFNHRQVEIVVRNTGGQVTAKLHKLSAGDTIAIRGPYGNGFPINKLEGSDIVAIAGGCGIPPIASLLEYIARRRLAFGKVFFLYGSQGPEHFALKSRITHFRNKKIDVRLTIDQPQIGWRGRTGFVSDQIKNLTFDPEKTFALMCGPGPMFAACAAILAECGVPDQRILVSEERKMSCGIGKCQHCTCGKFYVCTDGPVFSYDQIKDIYD